jgi:biotin-(acetyl-CoA carboxylase) ligase
MATGLARHLRPCPTPKEMAARILESLGACFLRAKAEGLTAVLGRLERFWGSPRSVALDLDGVEEKGIFEGVECDGRLRLRVGAQCRYYEASQVRQLRELGEPI